MRYARVLKHRCSTQRLQRNDLSAKRLMILCTLLCMAVREKIRDEADERASSAAP
jgi:hypothetical protein